MKKNELFPHVSLRHICLLLIICFCYITQSAVVALAKGNGDSAPPPRPVARLIGSIRPSTTTTISRTNADAAPPVTRPRAVLIAANSKPLAIAITAPVRVAAAAASMTAATSVERRAFDMINEQRIANNEQPFVWDAELTSMARIHSEHMATQNFFNHVGPDGQDVVARAHACDIYGWQALGENISYNQGYDDPAAFAVERWMKSTKHRTNILNNQFSRAGLGVARAADGRIFFTQVFAAR